MSKISVRRLLSIVISLTCIITLFTGCGSEPSGVASDTTAAVSTVSEGSSASESSSAEPVEISFWHHYNAQSAENKTLTDVIIPEFNKKFPNITVKPVSHEWDQLHKKILVSSSSGQLPDAARLDSAWLPEFQNLDILVALDKEMSDFKDVAGKLLEGPMNTAKIKGNYYGLGLNTNTKILFYNKEMFEQAGLNAPKTMDEFFETARKLTVKKDGRQIWGYSEPALSGWNICPFIWSNGGELTDPDCKVATGYINSEATVEIIQKLADLYKDGAMIGFNKGDIPMTDGYGTGRYAMIIDGPWKFAELKGSYKDFKAAAANMPAGKGGSAQVLGGEDISVFTNGQKAAAWEFIKFMTGDFAQTEMAKVGQIPVNTAALNSDTVKNNADMAPFIEALKTARARPAVSTWPAIDKELTNAVLLAVMGEKPVKEVMDALAVKMDELLKKAQE